MTIIWEFINHSNHFIVINLNNTYNLCIDMYAYVLICMHMYPMHIGSILLFSVFYYFL